MSSLEEIKQSIKRGIEEERARMNESYDRNIKNIENMNNIPTAMKELVNVYGNSLEQREKMIEILNSYLEADFFKDAFNGRNGRSVVKGANNIYFNNGEYYVGFSTSRLYTIQVGRNERVLKPNKTFKSINPDTVKFNELWDEYVETKENYDKVIDFYSILTRAKPAGIIYKMSPSLRSNIVKFAKMKKNEIKKYKERKSLWKEKIKEFDEEKKLFRTIMNDLGKDLSRFSEAGWRITYENLDDLM